MAITIGLGQSSIRLSMGTNSTPRLAVPEVILPNSLMSAPATKVVPLPISTAAFTLGSLAICSMASEMPSGTPGLKAFTGGLLTVMTAISLSFVSWTRSLMGFFLGFDSLVSIQRLDLPKALQGGAIQADEGRGKSNEWLFSWSNPLHGA